MHPCPSCPSCPAYPPVPSAPTPPITPCSSPPHLLRWVVLQRHISQVSVLRCRFKGVGLDQALNKTLVSRAVKGALSLQQTKREGGVLR